MLNITWDLRRSATLRSFAKCIFHLFQESRIVDFFIDIDALNELRMRCSQYIQICGYTAGDHQSFDVSYWNILFVFIFCFLTENNFIDFINSKNYSDFFHRGSRSVIFTISSKLSSIFYIAVMNILLTHLTAIFAVSSRRREIGNTRRQKRRYLFGVKREC